MYKPTRDHRFEYATDLIQFIEDRQCSTGCLYAKDEEEFPMCHEYEGAILLEQPVDGLDDRGDDGVVCTSYVPQSAHPDQGRLFDE